MHTLVLVDDDEAILRIYRRALAAEYALHLFSRADEALAAIDAGLLPDLVVSDLMMPGMTGIEFREALRAGHPALSERFVFCSGSGDQASLGEYLARERVEIYHKPIDHKEFKLFLARRLAGMQPAG